MVTAAENLKKIDELIAQAYQDFAKARECEAELLIRIARLEVQRDIMTLTNNFVLSKDTDEHDSRKTEKPNSSRTMQ